MMKKCLLLMAMLSMVLSAAALNLSDETLNYNVSYKWGIVHKNAGKATLSLRVKGNTCNATLVGRTDPWADRIYKLRDTLTTTFSKNTLVPIRYERIAHENGTYARDIVNFTQQGQTFNGRCTRYRQAKKSEKITEATSALTAQGMTVDMLSAFYYLRSLDFANMQKGQSQTINIFSGKKRELLTIKYQGRETLKLNGKNYEAYRIRFTFTTDGRQQSSDPIEAWISADGRQIPLQLEGALKVGKVRCTYTGG